ncbi:hypothetical protein F4802DRAFT_464790 [Xylaria palmicola]|nr:hypothetical protein F4802DRAFT_464790 [Xylaria palmicola]
MRRAIMSASLFGCLAARSSLPVFVELQGLLEYLQYVMIPTHTLSTSIYMSCIARPWPPCQRRAWRQVLGYKEQILNLPPTPFPPSLAPGCRCGRERACVCLPLGQTKRLSPTPHLSILRPLNSVPHAACPTRRGRRTRDPDSLASHHPFFFWSLT